MKVVITITLVTFLSVGISDLLLGQGIGGGLYLENGTTCEGSIVRNNQAINGYGIGGGDALLFNATVVGNLKLRADSSSVQVGFIYCADGALVDTVEYRKNRREDAVGVVFWVRRDVDAPYPAGAVIALEEIEEVWSNSHILHATAVTSWLKEAYGEEWYNSAAQLKDTACYQTTQKIYELDGSPAAYDHNLHGAGTYCYLFEAQRQTEDNPLKWALPTYVYLLRVLAAYPVVTRTLAFLERHEPALTVHHFVAGKLLENCWYWSCEDNSSNQKEQVYCINFRTGSTGNAGVGQLESLKTNRYNIRPILVY